MFVSKFNSTGTGLIYSTYIGGGLGKAIAVDSSFNAYITGDTQECGTCAYFPPYNAFNYTYGGNNDAIVTKLSYGGNALIYSSYLGGSQNDEGDAITVDSSGNCYVSGYTLVH